MESALAMLVSLALVETPARSCARISLKALLCALAVQVCQALFTAHSRASSGASESVFGEPEFVGQRWWRPAPRRAAAFRALLGGGTLAHRREVRVRHVEARPELRPALAVCVCFEAWMRAGRSVCMRRGIASCSGSELRGQGGRSESAYSECVIPAPVVCSGVAVLAELHVDWTGRLGGLLSRSAQRGGGIRASSLGLRSGIGASVGMNMPRFAGPVSLLLGVRLAVPGDR